MGGPPLSLLLYPHHLCPDAGLETRITEHISRVPRAQTVLFLAYPQLRPPAQLSTSVTFSGLAGRDLGTNDMAAASVVDEADTLSHSSRLPGRVTYPLLVRPRGLAAEAP